MVQNSQHPQIYKLIFIYQNLNPLNKLLPLKILQNLNMDQNDIKLIPKNLYQVHS